jgi:hypothetical protein
MHLELEGDHPVPLTTLERRKQNKLNAMHSTGPRSDEGKSKASQNALKYGLTARVLTLPGENPDDIQTQADAWHDAAQPENHDEEVLVDQLALASLRLGRLAKAETAILSAQVIDAENLWERQQERDLAKYTRMLHNDVRLAMIELRSFGAGVRWLLDRWIELKCAFELADCWNSFALIKEAIRLYGFDPERLVYSQLEGYEFALHAVCCLPDYKSRSHLASYVDNQMPPLWKGLTEVRGYSVEEARAGIREKMTVRIGELAALAEHFDQAEKTLRDTAADRAMAPADTGQNRLLIRYMKSTESSFDRTRKALAKLQSERQKAAEKEARETAPEVESASLPNEADCVGQTRSKRIHVGSCITINTRKYEVLETSDGNLFLCPWVEAPAEPVLGVVAAPETGV